MTRVAAIALCTLSTALPSCASTADARRQIVVVVDTDLPVTDQVAADPSLSADATIDTLRIDVLGEGDRVTSVREISATSHLDWPVSFGVAPPPEGTAAPVRLRIRAFRAADARSSIEDSSTRFDPQPELALDRVVEIPVPDAHVVDHRLVFLSSSCLGRPSSFRTRTSCVDALRTSSPFATELPRVALPLVSRTGSWERARAAGCRAAAPEGTKCIPGGISVLGSRELVGLEDGLVVLPTLPMRLAWVAPFAIDAREFTVGRARPLLPRLKGKPPIVRGDPTFEQSAFCTFSQSATDDDLPLTCIKPETAAELCALVGGDLPTEAEWNHAATGRGERRTFAWGNTYAGCCQTAIARYGQRTDVSCEGVGADPVGSHAPARAECAGAGDVSRDGVLDLGGNVSEIVADAPRSLDDDCFGDAFGVLMSPRCESPITPRQAAARGGNWNGVLSMLSASVRLHAVESGRFGFRCVYREAP